MRCAACSHQNPEGARFCMSCGHTVSAPGEENTLLINRAQSADQGYEHFLGQVINGYRVTRKLGVGGMGAVFEATQVKLNRKVAIKVLQPSSFGDARAVLRFEREAQTLAQLDHPAVIPVFDMFEAHGMRCIAMGYAAGGSLRELIGDVGIMPEDQAADIIGQVALGLWAVAQKGIIHRDIKPGNLLLASDGQIKIGDFGLVKSTQAEGLTKTGMVIGTPAYMAPEQFTDVRSADHRSDLYSLGCVLYEMVSGRIPFQGPSVVMFLRQHLKKVPELSGLSISNQLFRILERLLAKKPEHRFQTGKDLYDALLPLMGEGFGRQMARRKKQHKISSRRTRPGSDHHRMMPTIKATRTPTPGRMAAELRAQAEAVTIRKPMGHLTPPPSGRVGPPPSGRVGQPPSGRVGQPPSGRVGRPPSGRVTGRTPVPQRPSARVDPPTIADAPPPLGFREMPEMHLDVPRGAPNKQQQPYEPGDMSPDMDMPTLDLTPEEAARARAEALGEESPPKKKAAAAAPRGGSSALLTVFLTLVLVGGGLAAAWVYRDQLGLPIDERVDWQSLHNAAQSAVLQEQRAFEQVAAPLTVKPAQGELGARRLGEARALATEGKHAEALHAFLEAERLYDEATAIARGRLPGGPPEEPDSPEAPEQPETPPADTTGG